MPKVGPLPPGKVGRTLIDKLVGKADKIRQLATKLGIRPYRVFLVHSGWTGEERGEGRERELSRVELLPTPRVSPLDAVSRVPFHAGAYPVGSIRVDEISMRYTEDQLNGLGYPRTGADEVPERFDFWYELVEDGRSGGPVRPQKYRILGQPFRNAEQVFWAVALERISDDPPARQLP
jgi:hypothetical protein